MRKLLWSWLAIHCLGGCITGGDHEEHDPFHGTAVKWHQGTMEQAFALAKLKDKPVFLYWGASWCPPCNEIKAQVFTKEKFKELMSLAVPVYLDGDTDYAQVWGELFQISGYPTLLLLDESKQELMRISESVTIDEFEMAFQSGIANAEPFQETLERAVSGKASDQDWRKLAFSAWYSARDLDLQSDAVLAQRKQLADQVPAPLKVERALLSAKLLEGALAQEDPTPTAAQIRQNAGTYINNMMNSEEAIFASRSTLIVSAKSILDWSYKQDGRKRTLMRDKWLAAVSRLRQNPGLSTDTKLWTWYPEIELSEVTATLKSNVRNAVAQADAAAESDFERQAVISGAAYLLRKLGDFDAASTLLLKEAEQSKSPFYYFSSLANLEKERGDKEKALAYAAKARTSADGKATKLQWIVSDVRMSTQFADESTPQRLQELCEEFYSTLFQIKDGFAGRSYRSTKRLAKILSEQKLKDRTRHMLGDYQRRCKSLGTRDKPRCDDHFKTALGESQTVPKAPRS